MPKTGALSDPNSRLDERFKAFMAFLEEISSAKSPLAPFEQH
jgi:hypothetical protein